MKHLILKVRDKTKALNSLKQYCNIVYVSDFINVIGVEINEENIFKLSNDNNILDISESRKGFFQPA
ncbi:MAG: hypothetical protein AB7V16_08900 [Vulcanibacillus sp.]